MMLQRLKSPNALLFLAALFVLTLDKTAAKEDEAASCPCAIASLPDLRKKELTARWMVHSINWGVLSTVSSRLEANENGAIPFGNVYSFVDGPCNNSTGTPYFYGTYMDQSFADSLANTNAALTLSEASVSSVCIDNTNNADSDNKPYKRQACQIGSKYGDPENPVCARLTLTGTLVEVTDHTEKDFALQALFQRHSTMQDWPHDHEWVVGKLVLSDVWLIDYFGGASILDLDAYYAANDFMTTLLDTEDGDEEEDKD